MNWHCRNDVYSFHERPLIMGILNVTPDSFSDGGRFKSTEEAVEAGLQLIADGADLLDIGGESSRPGASPVSAGEELARVLPVVKGILVKQHVAISIDTIKSQVAEACLDAGAVIINDISGLQNDIHMSRIALKYNAGVIVMHMQGTPATMQNQPRYRSVVKEVNEFFATRLNELQEQGLPRESLAIDPGIGFGKTSKHNLTLLNSLDSFSRLQRPLCLGVSRKRFIGELCQRETRDRDAGSLAVVCEAIARKNAQILRVHDVSSTRDAVIMISAIHNADGDGK